MILSDLGEIWEHLGEGCKMMRRRGDCGWFQTGGLMGKPGMGSSDPHFNKICSLSPHNMWGIGAHILPFSARIENTKISGQRVNAVKQQFHRLCLNNWSLHFVLNIHLAKYSWRVLGAYARGAKGEAFFLRQMIVLFHLLLTNETTREQWFNFGDNAVLKPR